MKLKDSLEKLFHEWDQQKRSLEIPWTEVKTLEPKEISKLVNIMEITRFSENPKGYDKKPAAASFLAMTRSETAFHSLEKCLEGNDFWAASWVLYAINLFWPDPRFIGAVKRLIKRAHKDPPMEQIITIRCGLMLYRSGSEEGLDILIEQAKDFDSAYEAQNYRGRSEAAGYLAKYVSSTNLEKLVSLLGQGVYAYISDRLIKEARVGDPDEIIPVIDNGIDAYTPYGLYREGKSNLISKLKKEMSLKPWGESYIAFTLCRLGDLDGFELTKEVFLNYERYKFLDRPFDWSLRAMTRRNSSGFADEGYKYSSEQISPILVNFLGSKIKRRDGGNIDYICQVIFAIGQYPQPEGWDQLQKLYGEAQTNINWSEGDRNRINQAIGIAEEKFQEKAI